MAMPTRISFLHFMIFSTSFLGGQVTCRRFRALMHDAYVDTESGHIVRNSASIIDTIAALSCPYSMSAQVFYSKNCTVFFKARQSVRRQ